MCNHKSLHFRALHRKSTAHLRAETHWPRSAGVQGHEIRDHRAEERNEGKRPWRGYTQRLSINTIRLGSELHRIPGSGLLLPVRAHTCQGVPRRAPRGWRNVNRTEAEPQMWRRWHESHGPLGAGHAAAGPAGPPGGAAVNRAASLGDVGGGVSHARSERRAPRFAHPQKRRPPSLPVRSRPAEPWAGDRRKLLPQQQRGSRPSGRRLRDGSLTGNPLVTEAPRGTTRGM